MFLNHCDWQETHIIHGHWCTAFRKQIVFTKNPKRKNICAVESGVVEEEFVVEQII